MTKACIHLCLNPLCAPANPRKAPSQPKPRRQQLITVFCSPALLRGILYSSVPHPTLHLTPLPPKGSHHMPHCNHTNTFVFLKLTSEVFQFFVALILVRFWTVGGNIFASASTTHVSVKLPPKIHTLISAGHLSPLPPDTMLKTCIPTCKVISAERLKTGWGRSTLNIVLGERGR